MARSRAVGDYQRELEKIMSQALAKKPMTEAEYLAFDEKSKIRYEFMDGKLYAMAGASRNHNLANTNISRELGNQLLETNCEVYVSDFRVRIREGHNVYPDVAVACGDIQTTDKENTLLNPIVVFEVLSKSTEQRDRGDKAEDYYDLPSLQDYILVSQYRVRVEHFSRQKNNVWLLNIYEKAGETIELNPIKCKISLKMIYLKMKITPLKLVKNKKKNGKQRG